MSRPIAWGLGALAVVLGLAAVVGLLERAPTGPVEPAWDRQACAHCRMHLSERGFASQLHSAQGEVVYFDDPGCLFLWQAERRVEAAAIYHHHLREERWLAEDDAGFVRVHPTPMAWGFGAVERSQPGALTPEEARREVLESSGAAPPASLAEVEEEGHGQPAR